jgi:GNAT superfamily N-acetyltransferase
VPSYRSPEPLDHERHRSDLFDCGEPSLTGWLRRHAVAANASGSARVYVCTLEDGATVVGYYALAGAQVAPDEATVRARKGQPATRPIPAILIARLAVDREHQNAGLGRSLLQDALLRCAQASGHIGARVVLVHAKPEARAWYVRHGFEPSPTDDHHLLVLLKDVRISLRA